MTAAEPAPPPLTAEQMAQAEALWREAERLRLQGVNMSVLSTASNPWRLRPVGRPFDILINKTTLSPT